VEWRATEGVQFRSHPGRYMLVASDRLIPMITWKQWVQDSTGGASARAIASRINVSPSSVATWMRTERPPASAVVEIARAYSADIVVGLVTAGIMSEDDVKADVERRLRHVPMELLLAELARRSESGEGFDSTEPVEWSMLDKDD
jgi:DNA-binding transcriptional regulator YdaS (Cro superfamily)